MLSVATWNVLSPAFTTPERYPSVDASVLDATYRINRITDWVLSNQINVTCLQEATWPLVDKLTSALGPERVLWLPREFRRSDGLAIVLSAEVAVLNYEELTMPSSKDRSRVAQVMDFRFNDTFYSLANVHISWAAPTDERGSNRALTQIRTVLNALASHSPDTHILVGDVNAPPNSKLRGLLAEEGLVELQGDSPTAYVNGHPASLDVITARNVRAKMRPPLFDSSRPLPSPQCPSDHIPLTADLETTSTQSD